MARDRSDNAERQARYRESHVGSGKAERLSMVVSAAAKQRLVRLAGEQGTTQRQYLERMLADAWRAREWG